MRQIPDCHVPRPHFSASDRYDHFGLVVLRILGILIEDLLSRELHPCTFSVFFGDVHDDSTAAVRPQYHESETQDTPKKRLQSHSVLAQILVACTCDSRAWSRPTLTFLCSILNQSRGFRICFLTIQSSFGPELSFSTVFHACSPWPNHYPPNPRTARNLTPSPRTMNSIVQV